MTPLFRLLASWMYLVPLTAAAYRRDHPGERVCRDRRRPGRGSRLAVLQKLPHAIGDALEILARQIQRGL